MDKKYLDTQKIILYTSLLVFVISLMMTLLLFLEVFASQNMSEYFWTSLYLTFVSLFFMFLSEVISFLRDFNQNMKEYLAKKKDTE